jgi:hypothetical protein
MTVRNDPYHYHNARPARSIIVAESGVHRAMFDTARVDPDDLIFPEFEPELELEGEVLELALVPVPVPELLLDILIWPDISVEKKQVTMVSPSFSNGMHDHAVNTYIVRTTAGYSSSLGMVASC